MSSHDLTPARHAARHRRAHRRRAAALSVLALIALAIVAVFALPDHDRAVARPKAYASAPQHAVTHSLSPIVPVPLAGPINAVVKIDRRLRTRAVPPSFLGLSTEYWALPVYERHMALLDRVLSLLHVPGDGPLVLRVGGDSADHTFWDPRAAVLPRWMFGLTPSFLSRMSALVSYEHLRLIIDLNLITGNAQRAAEVAGAAERALPQGSILGFEIGNEPDVYSRQDWLAILSETPLQAAFLRKQLSTATYTHEFLAYSRALARTAPGVPLEGPALADPVRDVNWLSNLTAAPHPGLGMLTAHRYLYTACAHPWSPAFPTVARLLSQRASAGLARGLRRAVRIAHRAGLPFRLTELNSVACRGVAGVSDSFATALWAPDALFELLRAGVNGVNVHVRTNAINAAFTLGAQGLGARPLLYGLILFARALGPSPKLVHVHLYAKRALHLEAWATRTSGNRLHVLLIDKGNRTAVVRLKLPARGPATVQRLLAPSATSISGETLAGQRLGPDGEWEGSFTEETVQRSRGSYVVVVPRASAALISVRLAGRHHKR